MNTLQKITDLETKISKIEAKQQAFEVLAANMPKLQQEVTRVNTDIAQIVQSIKNLVDGVNKRTKDLGEMDNMVITRMMGLEQASASLSKTLAAITSTLSDAKILDQEEVMTRLRKSDEAADKARLEQMVQLKVLKENDEILPDSLIVVGQKFTTKDGKVDLIAEFRSMEMSSPVIDEETRKNYVGKRAGDVVDLNLEDGTLTTTILQVYAYVQQYAGGSAEGTQENAPTDTTQEATQQTEAQ